MIGPFYVNPERSPEEQDALANGRVISIERIVRAKGDIIFVVLPEFLHATRDGDAAWYAKEDEAAVCNWLGDEP